MWSSSVVIVVAGVGCASSHTPHRRPPHGGRTLQSITIAVVPILQLYEQCDTTSKLVYQTGKPIHSVEKLTKTLLCSVL
jgi:hypothetical protein